MSDLSDQIMLVEFRFGRNIHNVPMDDHRWESFIAEAHEHLEHLAAAVQDESDRELQQWIEVHRGNGTWDGIAEESAIVTLYTDGVVEELAHDRLLPVAQAFATEFQQDAVALVVGSVQTWRWSPTVGVHRMHRARTEVLRRAHHVLDDIADET
jgi:hypothetical protein